MRYIKWLNIALVCLLLASCIPSHDIERLGVINSRGVDLGEENIYETTLAIYQFEGESKDTAKIVAGKGKSIKGALKDANNETNFMLAPGKIQLELYGRKAAEYGILPFIETLYRDANLPNTSYLAVSDGDAKDIIRIQEKDISMNIGKFLHGLIEENSTPNRFPRVMLPNFIRDFYDIGVDPILPLFKLNKDVPKLSAIAVMQDDKMVGEISIDNAILLNMIRKSVRAKWLEVSLPMEPFEKFLEKDTIVQQRRDTLHTAYNILRGKSNTKYVGAMKFETEVQLDLELVEISEKVIISPEVEKIIEKEVAKELKKKYEKLLSDLKELNADPFGYGVIYRINQKDGHLKNKEWREKFPNIEVDYKLNVRLVRHGTID
ncbi:Ger(x)C family spore germination protein [Lederbergia graminis]|uniref:Ger(X)C family spore germination protein n=1 Tax=Lederbergia graminis TaxID=735518 RepID=A0ABW0LKI8_9BACI